MRSTDSGSNDSSATDRATQNDNAFQLSVRELMFVTALVATFMAIFSFIGWGNPFVWFCVIVSLALTFLYGVFLPTRNHYQLAFVTVGTAVASVMLCMVFSVALIVNSCLHLLLLVVSWSYDRPFQRKQTVYISLALMLVSFLVGVGMGMPDYLKLLNTREKFQPEILSSRLDWEKVGTPAKQELRKSRKTTPVLKADGTMTSLSGEWELFELQQSQFASPLGSDRISALKNLHSTVTESFIKAQGFGVGRMFFLHSKDVATPEISDLPYRSESGTRDFGLDYQLRNLSASWNPESINANFHLINSVDFLNPEFFGVKNEDTGEHRGFVPHVFSVSPGTLEHQNETWEVTRLQLISMLRFDEPKVYEFDHLPRMDQLSSENAPTRPLNVFEKQALVELKDIDNAFVVRRQGDRVVALGELLAVESCLECHSVERGEILGAFTYEFSRLDNPASDD